MALRNYLSTNRFSLGGEHFYTGAVHPEKRWASLCLSLSLTHTHPYMVFGEHLYNTQASQVISVVKTLPANGEDSGDVGSIPGSERCPGEGNGNPTPIFLPGKSHGQRSLTS